jgi:hypothetical protein
MAVRLYLLRELLVDPQSGRVGTYFTGKFVRDDDDG